MVVQGGRRLRPNDCLSDKIRYEAQKTQSMMGGKVRFVIRIGVIFGT